MTALIHESNCNFITEKYNSGYCNVFFQIDLINKKNSNIFYKTISENVEKKYIKIGVFRFYTIIKLYFPLSGLSTFDQSGSRKMAQF